MMGARLLLVLLVLLASGCSLSREAAARLYHLQALAHPAPVARRALPGGIESVCSRGSVTWIVPVNDGGVVLVDTGFDEQARAIQQAVKGRTIHAILLTHGHLDHAAGTAALDAPVWVGAADAPALRGQPLFRALYPRVGEFLAGVPVARGVVHGVDDGLVLRFGERVFQAIATPGHTDGSTSWLLVDVDDATAPDGRATVLFGGDALLSPLGDEVFPAPPGFTADLVVAYDSIRRLLEVDIDYLADAHYGVVAQPARALRRAVEREHDDVTLREHPAWRPVSCADDPVAW
jgi:glyoxylase-like metal-dependent hydrolase (beta-lactamase superfamily II)